jgi:hypothetical protein
LLRRGYLEASGSERNVSSGAGCARSIRLDLSEYGLRVCTKVKLREQDLFGRPTRLRGRVDLEE